MRAKFSFEERYQEAREASYDAQSPGGGEVITQQHFREETDINVIVQRFGLTGQLPRGAVLNGVYGDFTGITDYESAVATIEAAQVRFNQLPPELREKFENDPGRLVEYAESHTQEEWDRDFGAAAPVVPVVPVAALEPAGDTPS